MALLHAIRSPSKPLRHVVGTNVAVIVGVGGLPTWPELLMSFVQCLESSDPNALEGALDALYKVCLSLQEFAGDAERFDARLDALYAGGQHLSPSLSHACVSSRRPNSPALVRRPYLFGFQHDVELHGIVRGRIEILEKPGTWN